MLCAVLGAVATAACGPGHMQGRWELRQGDSVRGYLDIQQTDRGAPLSPDQLMVDATLRGQDIHMAGDSYGAGFEVHGPGCRESTRTCADTVWFYLEGNSTGRIRNDFDATLSVWDNAFGPSSHSTALERETLHGHRVQ